MMTGYYKWEVSSSIKLVPSVICWALGDIYVHKSTQQTGHDADSS